MRNHSTHFSPPEHTLMHRLFAFLTPSDVHPPWLMPAITVTAGGLSTISSLPAAWIVLAIFIVTDLLTGSYAAGKRATFTLRRFGDGLIRKMILVTLVGAIYSVSWALQVGYSLATTFAFCLAGLDFVSTMRNCKRGRIKLPPGLQRLATWVDAVLNAELDRKVDGIAKIWPQQHEEDANWDTLQANAKARSVVERKEPHA